MKADQRKRLLVVDDDADIRKVLRANLELHGFDVATVGSWTEARGILGKELPDLVVLDLMLPDGDGMNICSDIKRTYPKIPIIMLTARDKISDKVTGFECGADDYIVKPFETLELIARIKACLRRGVPAEERMVIGDISIDFRTREVSVRGRPIELTPRQYDLLCLLVSNRGEPLSRDIIKKTIWKGSQIYSWSRVIDVHIQHLRQKIERDPNRPEYIITIPGVGYKFK